MTQFEVESAQRISLCSCLYLKLAKRHVSLVIFYVFSSTKLENRRAEQVLPRTGGGGGTCGNGELRGNGWEDEYSEINVYTCR
jgi:hypothetical protein